MLLINLGPVHKYKLDKSKKLKVRMPWASGKCLRLLTSKNLCPILCLSHQTYGCMLQSFPNNYFNIKSQYQVLYAIIFISLSILIGKTIHPTKFSKLVRLTHFLISVTHNPAFLITS